MKRVGDGFDFSTVDVQDWEIAAIHAAIDDNTIEISRHAAQEASLDGLTADDVLDIIGLYDKTTKDLPGNPLRRAAGINFEREVQGARLLAKVGWRTVGYYVVVTVMAK